ncbi:hypothetical protein DSO57_1007535 [Entomophthora muscae]|uniref:Uncharacterized protein n=1 Tax=Entomophthora muscae TaxID=34485 RepID=A0ACC2UT84_9FUNG|nr:hypothetical protein DSO57_1007535 [Entomophthora muscae]
MILPALKFVVFSLAPFLLLLWSTLPNLWLKISSLARLMSEAPSSLLSLPGSLLYSGEAVMKSLTCNDLDLGDINYTSLAPVAEKVPMSSLPDPEESNSVHLRAPVMLSSSPTCTPWLITGLALMALNVYFPQLSLVSSLWTPPQAAVPVIHWAASWWFVLLGWEPNLVSLAPLSHNPHLIWTPKNHLIFFSKLWSERATFPVARYKALGNSQVCCIQDAVSPFQPCQSTQPASLCLW